MIVATSFMLCLFFLGHPDFNLSYGQTAPRQKYIGDLVLSQTGKIHSDISPTPHLNFTEGQKVQNLPRFSTSVAIIW